MKTPHIPPLISGSERSYHLQIHAAVARLPVYEIEHLAHTDLANIPPVNVEGTPVIRHSWLEKSRRWLRIRR